MTEAVDMAEFSQPVVEDKEREQRKLELQAGGVTANPILPPATIQTRSDGKRFVTTELESIHFDRIGLFATGKWDGEGDELEILFLWDDVARIEYDYTTVREILAEGDEELVSAPE